MKKSANGYETTIDIRWLFKVFTLTMVYKATATPFSPSFSLSQIKMIKRIKKETKIPQNTL